MLVVAWDFTNAIYDIRRWRSRNELSSSAVGKPLLAYIGGLRLLSFAYYAGV